MEQKHSEWQDVEGPPSFHYRLVLEYGTERTNHALAFGWSMAMAASAIFIPPAAFALVATPKLADKYFNPDDEKIALEMFESIPTDQVQEYKDLMFKSVALGKENGLVVIEKRGEGSDYVLLALQWEPI